MAALRQRLDAFIEEIIENGINFPEARREFEKRFITHVMTRENGNLSRAARVLRIHRNTLSKKLTKHKIRR